MSPRQVILASTALALLLAPGLALSQGAPGDASGGVLAQTAPQAQPAAPDGTPGGAAGRAIDRTPGTTPAGQRAQGTIPAPAGLAVEQEGLRTSHRMSKLIGASLYNESNERVGEVDDVLLPAAGGQTIVVISVGGFLGIGAKLVAVPFERLRAPAGEATNWVLAGATKESLGSLPTFAYASGSGRS